MRELRILYQRDIVAALTASIILHLVIVGLMWMQPSLWTQEPETHIRLLPYTSRNMIFVQPGAPPGGASMARPRVSKTPPPAMLSGTPVPVPDRPEVDTPTTITPMVPEQSVEGIGSGGTGGGQGFGGAGGQGSGNVGPETGAAPPPPPPPGDAQPRLLKKIEPVYPRLAKIAGIEGLVVLSLRVDESGNVTEAAVVKSLGNTGCDEAAVTAALQWKFAPALRQGKPMSVRITAPILFTLRNAR